MLDVALVVVDDDLGRLLGWLGCGLFGGRSDGLGLGVVDSDPGAVAADLPAAGRLYHDMEFGSEPRRAPGVEFGTEVGTEIGKGFGGRRSLRRWSSGAAGIVSMVAVHAAGIWASAVWAGFLLVMTWLTG